MQMLGRKGRGDPTEIRAENLASLFGAPYGRNGGHGQAGTSAGATQRESAEQHAGEIRYDLALPMVREGSLMQNPSRQHRRECGVGLHGVVGSMNQEK